MAAPLFCCSFDVMARSAGNGAGAAAHYLQAQHLLDVCSDQLGLQMTFLHKLCDV